MPSRAPSSIQFWPAILSALLGMVMAACIGLAVVFVYVLNRPDPGRSAALTDIPASSSISDNRADTSARVVPDGDLPSGTPFLPLTSTPSPSATPMPTNTPTETPSPSPTTTNTETPTPIPTATAIPVADTPIPAGLPDQAEIINVTGHAQALPLSCEARSAVDWATFFGGNIPELDFQANLPLSLNPNTGFVGEPHDERGQLPPQSYGVHAAPIAALLRTYGINAQSVTGAAWEAIRGQIADNKPVIAWVIGNVWDGAFAQTYTAPDGETLLVARFEHTVLVVGYTRDTVTVIDNQHRDTLPLSQFLDSWAVLGNMAVIHP